MKEEAGEGWARVPVCLVSRTSPSCLSWRPWGAGGAQLLVVGAAALLSAQHAVRFTQFHEAAVQCGVSGVSVWVQLGGMGFLSPPFPGSTHITPQSRDWPGTCSPHLPHRPVCPLQRALPPPQVLSTSPSVQLLAHPAPAPQAGCLAQAPAPRGSSHLPYPLSLGHPHPARLFCLSFWTLLPL